MIEYNNDYAYLSDFISEAIKNHTSKGAFCYFVSVKETNGFFVETEFTTNENQLMPIKEVPIIQSAYLSPIIQKGDFGLLIDIRLDLTNLLENKPLAENAQNSSFYVFLPLLQKQNFQSKANILSLKSADLKSKVELSNESLKIECDLFDLRGKKPLKIKNDSTSLKEVLISLVETIDALKSSANVVGQASLQ